MNDLELACLDREIERIAAAAKSFGLDFFEMRFEICPADILYTFGAYGMPTRFSHWSFGKAYHRMKTQYDFNLSRIYELVINSDPCYAFLLDGNTLLQNKVIAAHVFAHSDFFKHNTRFRHTSRLMVDSMATSAQRIRQYEFQHGRPAVESILDAAIALQEQIDPYEAHRPRRHPTDASPPQQAATTPYDDLWELDNKPAPASGNSNGKSRSGESHPSGDERVSNRDLLLYIAEHSRHLEDWQRDVIGVIRAEMLYFWPQLETKIMNEGWASLWHARIMRSLDLTDKEAVEFAKMHAQVLQPSRIHINPYHLGYKIFADMERRWENPTDGEREKYQRSGDQGLEKIFEVRETESDVSFLRNYLTQELVEELDLYIYRRVDDEWQVAEKDWEKVRDHLVHRMTHCGIPIITVEDGDYQRKGELYLRHAFDGDELDVDYLTKTLPYVYRLWGCPVHLETVVDDQPTVFSFDGHEHRQRS